MALLTVSGVAANARATSDRMGLRARPLEPTTLTANIKAAMAGGSGWRREGAPTVSRFCMMGILLE
ncbi:hypothetical protein [Achromobacter pulmonis]|uniref:hypothetical protein n=1 Tax=Achromobacter pulmonis TaxID=1389932 RepID=UPI0020C700C9|nr:hypothetical protein [Achromobacter pulmonis]